MCVWVKKEYSVCVCVKKKEYFVCLHLAALCVSVSQVVPIPEPGKGTPTGPLLCSLWIIFENRHSALVSGKSIFLYWNGTSFKNITFCQRKVPHYTSSFPAAENYLGGLNTITQVFARTIFRNKKMKEEKIIFESHKGRLCLQ